MTWHYITLHYTTLHYITLHYITLHYMLFASLKTAYFSCSSHIMRPEALADWHFVVGAWCIGPMDQCYACQEEILGIFPEILWRPWFTHFTDHIVRHLSWRRLLATCPKPWLIIDLLLTKTRTTTNACIRSLWLRQPLKQSVDRGICTPWLGACGGMRKRAFRIVIELHAWGQEGLVMGPSDCDIIVTCWIVHPHGDAQCPDKGTAEVGFMHDN